jgi:hypothetical protein
LILAGGASEVASAAIAAFGAIVGAGLAAWAVTATARSQKRPKIVDLEDDEMRSRYMTEREARIRAETERDVWKQIALDSRNGLPD